MLRAPCGAVRCIFNSSGLIAVLLMANCLRLSADAGMSHADGRRHVACIYFFNRVQNASDPESRLVDQRLSLKSVMVLNRCVDVIQLL